LIDIIWDKVFWLASPVLFAGLFAVGFALDAYGRVVVLRKR